MSSFSNDYQILKIHVANGVSTCTIHHKHPACVMTNELSNEIRKFVTEAEGNNDVRVIVFKSADPDFFIAHFDVTAIIEWAENPTAARFGPEQVNKVKKNGVSGGYRETIKNSRKVWIVEMAGRAGGGGNEFAAACDMRFGLKGKTKINQMEVPLGILPGGNGTINLPKLIGRNRALEVILGGVDVDAETLEKWGYLNRIFPSRESLSAHVDGFAKRIAQFPAIAVGHAKQSVVNALSFDMPHAEALKQEFLLFADLLRDPSSLKLMKAFIELKGGQTRLGELKVNELAPYLEFSKL